MHWKAAANGCDYLYSTTRRRERSLGVRSPETEAIFNAHADRLSTLKDRLKHIRSALNKTVRVSKALYLGRMPSIAARILRRLDDTGLLDAGLVVVGTNALFAYEAATGVLFDEPLIATEDLDLLWDPRRRLSLLLTEAQAPGVIALLKRVDRSFRKTRPYQIVNDDSYLVDLIRPPGKHEMFIASPRPSMDDEDFEPAAIAGLSWLVNAPKYDEIAIAQDGMPVRIRTIDPRAYALHKLWLSHQPNRKAIKTARDLLQARAVAAVAIDWLSLSFDANDLTALPTELMAGVAELTATRQMEPP